MIKYAAGGVVQILGNQSTRKESSILELTAALPAAHLTKGVIILIRKLEKRLERLQRTDYEYIAISDILRWIHDFRWERRVAQIEKRERAIAPLPGQLNLVARERENEK